MTEKEKDDIFNVTYKIGPYVEGSDSSGIYHNANPMELVLNSISGEPSTPDFSMEFVKYGKVNRLFAMVEKYLHREAYDADMADAKEYFMSIYNDIIGGAELTAEKAARRDILINLVMQQYERSYFVTPQVYREEVLGPIGAGFAMHALVEGMQAMTPNGELNSNDDAEPLNEQ